MTIYSGEIVTVLASALDPVRSTVISDGTAQAEFYAPGKNPVRVPADRVPDHGPIELTFDPTVINRDGTSGAYAGAVDTTGWTPGKWIYKATLVGLFNTWEYGSFRLAV